MYTENIVYYNGFWYSSFSPIGENPTDLILRNKRRSRKLKNDLRLLSLVFDTIHVPRSHFLTFQNSAHWNIVNSYVESKDFKYLIDNGVIKSSSLPFIDSYSDTERITGRVRDNNWSEDLSTSFLKSIKDLPSINVDSVQESKNNVNMFEEYISIIKGTNIEQAKELKEIVKKSTYKDIPFFHELFVEELLRNQNLSSLTKSEIWRFTNTLYMYSGCLDLGDDRRIPIDFDIENVEVTHDNSGMLRELYSPMFIETLISQELGDKYLLKYLELDIKEVLSFRYMKEWKGFKRDVFEMFETITQIEKIRPNEFANYNGGEKLVAFKKYIVGGDKAKFADLLSGLVELAAGEYDPILGKSVKKGNNIIAGLLVKKYSNYKINQVLTDYRIFWKKLKERLDGGK